MQTIVEKRVDRERSIGDISEIVSLESFVAGFRLAGGICMELSGEHYDYDIEEDATFRVVRSNEY